MADQEVFYDELSRLNNDLVNLQRKLAQKNAALALTYAKLQDSLRESETKYRHLASNMPGIAYQLVLTPKGKFRFEHMEESCIQLFGVSAAEIMADANLVFELIPQPDADKVRETIMKSAASLTPYAVEHRIIKENGETVWLFASSIPRKLVDGGIMWDGIGLNVTDRKIAEIALMESQGNLISLIDNTDDIIVSRDRKGRAVVFNRAFKEIVRLLFGVEAEPGIRTADYLPEEQKKHWEEVLSKVLKNGDRHREEFGWEIDGETHYYEISINPIRVGDEILGTTEFMRDITEKKIKEKQLLIKQDELKKYTQQLEEMNTAFKVLIDYRKEESDDIKRSIIGKFKKIVIPYFPMSPETKTREELLTTMSILGNNINEILFSNNTSEIKLTDLSPTETRVAFMIKSGKTSKEIADSLNMSPRTVYFHRENLRKKLKLSRTKTNLKTYLQSTNT